MGGGADIAMTIAARVGGCGVVGMMADAGVVVVAAMHTILRIVSSVSVATTVVVVVA